jgi:hypothetical protein
MRRTRLFIAAVSLQVDEEYIALGSLSACGPQAGEQRVKHGGAAGGCHSDQLSRFLFAERLFERAGRRFQVRSQLVIEPQPVAWLRVARIPEGDFRGLVERRHTGELMLRPIVE